MATSNPYSPPNSEVGDITAEAESFQPINIFSAQGRLSRLQYLAYTLGIYFVITAVAALLQLAVGSVVGIRVIALLTYCATITMVILLTIQRSHDMDWNGWTCLLVFIPVVGLIWALKAGSAGENRYGNPPPPNSTVVKIVGLLFPIMFVLGILAAIALPAYKQYTDRARAAQHLQQ